MTEFLISNDKYANIDDTSKGVVFSFGRFNPFTRGHLGLANKIIDTANKFQKKKENKI